MLSIQEGEEGGENNDYFSNLCASETLPKLIASNKVKTKIVTNQNAHTAQLKGTEKTSASSNTQRMHQNGGRLNNKASTMMTKQEGNSPIYSKG